jgi:hypothetical protein
MRTSLAEIKHNVDDVGKEEEFGQFKGPSQPQAPVPERQLNETLTFAAAHLLKCRFVPKGVFSRLHNEREPGRDRLGGFSCFGFFCRSHYGCRSSRISVSVNADDFDISRTVQF